MLALFDSINEINAIYLIFALELGLSTRPTDVEVKKIDNTMLDIY